MASDTIWWHGSESTLAQVMACCLTAPSHYLNQCWLINNGHVLGHSAGSNFRTNVLTILYGFENHIVKITATSPRGQWVKQIIAYRVEPCSSCIQYAPLTSSGMPVITSRGSMVLPKDLLILRPWASRTIACKNTWKIWSIAWVTNK